MVIVALLGLPVTMTADYPTTHKYKVHADFSDGGNVECSRQVAVESQYNFTQARRCLQLDGLGPHGLRHHIPLITRLESAAVETTLDWSSSY